MDPGEQLDAWAQEAREILGRFSRSSTAVHVAEGDQSRFTGLILEARDLLHEVLGPTNSFGLQLERTRIEGVMNYLNSQSYHSVEQAAGILKSAANAVRRKAAVASPSASVQRQLVYVDLARLDELRTLRHPDWDLRRMIRLCEELNSAFEAKSYLATAMLVRAITDHVPPIFGARTFAEYASSVAAKSHKSSLERLCRVLRDIADGALHLQIRQRESLPSAAQVDFRSELDLLLGEVVRALR